MTLQITVPEIASILSSGEQLEGALSTIPLAGDSIADHDPAQ